MGDLARSIDAERSRSQGRSVSRRDAVEKPTVDEILVAALEMGAPGGGGEG